MKILDTAVLLIAALSAASALASPEFTEATIYTEPHNAAAAYLGTLHFMVGRMGRDCVGPLSGAESFPQDLVARWEGRNVEYYRASKVYLGNLFPYYERTRGKDFGTAAMNEYLRSVQGQGAATAEGMLAAPDRKAACAAFVARVGAGDYDIKESRPYFKELTELVEIRRAFQK